MSLTREVYQAYCDILKEELRLAMGCTEPIAIAYSASIARSYLSEEPTSIRIGLSGNIIKNTKSVVVPATCSKRRCCGLNNGKYGLYLLNLCTSHLHLCCNGCV